MGKFFSLDNPVWNFLGKIVDMFVLSFLCILCSLPIFTMGASLTALYDTMMKLVKDNESGVFKDFFRSFKKHFGRGTLVFLILAVVGIILGGDLVFAYFTQTAVAKVLGVLFIVLTVIYVFVFTFVFPLIAVTDDGVRKVLARAFFMSIKEFPKTVLMVLTTAAIVAAGVFISAPILFIAPGLIAMLQSYIFNVIFKKTFGDSVGD